MTDLIERLRNFEGSDALGNGDFSLLHEAAAALEAARAEVERLQEIVRPKREDKCLTLDHWRMRAYDLEANWSRCSHTCAVEQTKREQAEARADKLAEALEKIRSRSSIDLAMRPDPSELTARLGDIHRIADAMLKAQGVRELAAPKPDTVADETGVEFFAVPEGLHPNTANLVARFATALAEKLAAAERKYGYSDNWARPDWMDECRQELVEHVAKGDPRDVAAYCAFLWHHGESTAGAKPDAVAGLVEKAYAGCTIWRGSLRVSVTETEVIEHRIDADEAFCDLAQRALDSLAAAWGAAALAAQPGGSDNCR